MFTCGWLIVCFIFVPPPALLLQRLDQDGSCVNVHSVGLRAKYEESVKDGKWRSSPVLPTTFYVFGCPVGCWQALDDPLEWTPSLVGHPL
jgi:hypothetical protein